MKDGREQAWTEGPEEFERSHGRSTWCTEEQEYMTDGDNVGRVKRDGGIKGLAETEHASTSERSHGGLAEMDDLGCLGFKTTSSQVSGLDIKTRGRVRCGRIAEVEGPCRNRESASRRRKVVKAVCSSDASVKR